MTIMDQGMQSRTQETIISRKTEAAELQNKQSPINYTKFTM